MNNHLTRLLCMGILASASLLPRFASAQSCDDVAGNPEWIEGMKALVAHIESEKYDEAIEVTKNLYTICPKMPSLNYYTGVAMSKRDPGRALIYFQEAAKNTSEFETSAAMSRRIWFTLYEQEHPDRTEAAISSLMANNIRLNEDVSTKQKAIDEQKEAIIRLENRVLLSDNDASSKVLASNAETRQKFGAFMWTGAGIGIAGLLMTGGGVAMVAFVDNKKDNGSEYQISKPYIGGWSLLGVGAGLTIAGAIVTGLAAYRYTHIEVPDSDVDLAFSLSPTGASFKMNF